jgi:hypothetical protein
MKSLPGKRIKMWAVGIPDGNNTHYIVCENRTELFKEIRNLLKLKGEVEELVVKSVQYSKEEFEALPDFDGI